MPHLWPTGSSKGWLPRLQPGSSPQALRIPPRGGHPALRFSYNRPARHYPRFWIWRPSSERQRDFNPPDQCAAQRTLCPRLTSARPSSRLVTGLARQADGQISPGIAHPPSSHLPVASTSVPSGWLRTSGLLAPSSRDGCLLCASCTSGREFACRFLQTPPHGDSPCGSANGSRHQGP